MLVLLVVASALGATLGADEDLRRLHAVELETALAKEASVYLVLDPGIRQLAVRVRATEVATVELSEVSRLVFEPLFGSVDPPRLEAPAVWTVLEGPGDTDRETIAPTTLRPYSDEEEEEETPATGSPAKPKPGDEAKPSSYRVRLDVGWQLLITDEAPRLGWARRLAASIRDGWLRLRGDEPRHPPLVALVMSSDDARRLHHLFRSGLKILVLATT